MEITFIPVGIGKVIFIRKLSKLAELCQCNVKLRDCKVCVVALLGQKNYN